MRREAVGVTLLVLAVFAAYAWSAHFWIDPVDEGYFLDMADRVARGEVPYREFVTYYTPGIFYLFAFAFKLFGTSILPIRLLMAGLRAVCALQLYALTRRVAPWPFALLPFLTVAALDHWPVEPEPHPSWPAIVGCLLTMEVVSRHLCSGRSRWLVLAGLTTGITFLFKQNIGAFTAIGLAGYIVLRPMSVANRFARPGQVLFAALLALLITVFLRPGLPDPLLAGALWLPAVATFALLARQAIMLSATDKSDRRPLDVLHEAALVAIPFVALTVLWLVPLAAALGGPSKLPIGLFLGSVDQTNIAEPYEQFTLGVPSLALAAIWLPMLFVLIRRRRPNARLLVMAVTLTLLIPVLPVAHGPRDILTSDTQLLPWVTRLDVWFGSLHLYLPSIAAWAGLAALAFRPTSGLPAWYLLFGSLALLTMYPRPDALHVITASPPVLIGGAWALWQACQRFRQRLPGGG